jgi:hypothetical protein
LQVVDRPSDEQRAHLRVVIRSIAVMACDDFVEDKASFIATLIVFGDIMSMSLSRRSQFDVNVCG